MIDMTDVRAFPILSSGDDFSACGHYRYNLWRTWDQEQRIVAFLMLNPSKATAIENDPTVYRCERRACMMGFGGLIVVNIFGMISTDPRALYTDPFPIGSRNDSSILAAANKAAMVICAWGEHAAFMERGQRVEQMLRREGFGPKLHHLGLNRSGHPRHPLYIPYSTKPRPWIEAMP